VSDRKQTSLGGGGVAFESSVRKKKRKKAFEKVCFVPGAAEQRKAIAKGWGKKESPKISKPPSRFQKKKKARKKAREGWTFIKECDKAGGVTRVVCGARKKKKKSRKGRRR